MGDGDVTCPDEGTLWRLAQAELEPSEAEVVRTHLDGCVACQSAVAALLRATGQGPIDLTADPGLPVADEIAGRYVVRSQLGRGAMATVFRAWDRQLEREVALKLLHVDANPAPAGTSGLARESKTMASLRHPNVVTVFDAFEFEGLLAVSMELCEGGSLRAWAASVRPWKDVCRVLVDAGRGLQAVHEAGWIHRDFKPDNVLLDEGGRAVVADFGLVAEGRGSIGTQLQASLSEEELDALRTISGHVLGTPVYMAPEQYRGENLDPRADVYAFCVAAVELFTGVRPFTGSSLAELQAAKERGVAGDFRVPAVPRGVSDVLRRGLSAQPRERPSSVLEVLEVLEGALHGRRWRPILAGAGIALSALVVYALASPDQGPCADRPGAISWTPDLEQRAGAAWSDDAQTPRAAAALGAFVQGWTQSWERVCAAPDPGRDAVGCLQQQHAWVEASMRAHVRGQLPPKMLIWDLPDPRECLSDGPAVIRRLPASPKAREHRDALRADVARAWDLRLEGRARSSYEAALALRERANALADPWTRAELDFVLGEAAFVLELGEDSQAAMQRANASGTASDHRVVVARSQLSLASSAWRDGDHELHEERLHAARVAVRRLQGTAAHAEILSVLQDVEAEFALAVGDIETARVRLEQSIAHAKAHAPELLAHRLGMLADVAGAQGETAEAKALYEEALLQARDVHTREVLSLNYGGLLLQLGELDAALEHTRTAAALAADREGEPLAPIPAWLNEVQALLSGGRYDEARAGAQRLLDWIDRHPHADPRHRAAALRFALELEAKQGKHRACVERARALSSDRDFDIHSELGVNVQLLEVGCLRELGQTDRALDVVTGAVGSASRHPETPTLTSLALAARAEIQLDRGRATEALSDVDEALALLPAADPWAMRPYVGSVRCQCLWHAGLQGDARDCIRTARSQLQGDDLDAFEAWAEHVGARSPGP